MMRGNSIPAFTVLEDSIDFPISNDTETPNWISMYNNNTILTNNPQNGQTQWINKPSNDYPTFAPKISPRYEEMLQQNSESQYLLNRQGLPSTPPRQFEEPMTLPSFSPPYGTPYPSSGYSFRDASLSADSRKIQAVSRPPVPAASVPALIDARHSPSVPLDPVSLEAYREYANQHFREGFRLGTEQRLPHCPEIVHHLSSCSLCKSVVHNQERLLLSVIGFLAIIVIILLILLFKKK